MVALEGHVRKGAEMSLPYFRVDTQNERLVTLVEKHGSVWSDFNQKLDLSWIYHDHGMEGVVLQAQEIGIALNQKVISTDAFLPAYQEIKNLHACIEWLRELSDARRSEKVTRALIQRCYETMVQRLRSSAKSDGLRQDDNRYGAYYHRHCSHNEVGAGLDAFVDFFNGLHADKQHPIVSAAQLHYRFMQLMPYGRFSGRLARWLTNLFLMRHGYPALVIHTAERARYYEALAFENESELSHLFTEAMNATVESACQYIQNSLEERRKKREAYKVARHKREEAAKRARETPKTQKAASSPRKLKAVSDAPTGKKARSASKRRPS